LIARDNGPSPADVLAEFPIHGEPALPGERADVPTASPVTQPVATSEAVADAASLAPRAVAFAADLAGTSLAVTLALVGAAAATGRAPRAPGLAWAGAFALTFSYAFVALPLTLFGRTVGMSLAGLVARAGAAGRSLTPAEASRRWVGTLAAAALLGAPLLFTRRDRRRPTPADRLSDRPLVRELEA